MRVPKDGDEFVGVDLRFNHGESGMATLVCERGAHLHKTDIIMHLRERESS